MRKLKDRMRYHTRLRRRLGLSTQRWHYTREPWARPDTAATTAGLVDTATGLPLSSSVLLRTLIANALTVCNEAMGPRALGRLSPCATSNALPYWVLKDFSTITLSAWSKLAICMITIFWAICLRMNTWEIGCIIFGRRWWDVGSVGCWSFWTVCYRKLFLCTTHCDTDTLSHCHTVTL